MVAMVAVGACEKPPRDRVERSKTFVLDEGAEPRFQLAYAIPEGSTETLDMIMDIEMSMSGGGMAGGEIVMPRMIMTTDIEVPKVNKDGSMQLVMITTDVKVQDRAGAMPGVAGTVESEVAEMIGMRMTATLMPDGRTKNLKLDEKSVSAKVRDEMRATEQAFDQMMALLPDVPVGKGARWRVEQTVRQGGIRLNTVSTYEVLEVSESGAKVHADIELDAPAQTIEQNGIKVRLDHMTGSGGFDTTVDFARLVDRVEGRLNMDMEMSAMGQSISLDMGMGIQILPTGEAAKPADVVEAE